MTQTASPPTVSIIVAAYKAEEYLARTLDSVAAQTFQDWECLIVDDGSPDGTLEVARQYAARDGRFKAMSQENAGQGAARNLGVEHCAASVEYLNFLDSDDILHPGALEALLAPLRGRADVAGSHGVSDQIDEEGRPLTPGEFAAYCRARLGFDGERIAPWPAAAPTTLAVLANCYYLLPPGVALVRRSFFERAGGFDASYRRGGEDWDLFNRLARLGDFLFVDRVVIGYRRHGGGATNDARAMHAAGHHVKRKLFFLPDNTPEQRRLLRGAYRAWQLHKCREKRALMLEDFDRRDVKRYAAHGAQALGHLLFRLRGFPTLNG